jgi:tryptophan-rich sensory protein
MTSTPAPGRRARFNPLLVQSLVAAVLAMAVAATGGAITQLGPWYRGLAKPSWQPPDWLFGPAWTLIFICTASAAVIAWRAAELPRQRATVLALMAANAACNVGWSLLFFYLHRPDWALLEVGLLWLSILVPLIVFGRLSRRAGWLLAPYLAWVSFAAFLNYTIVGLNAPWGGA